MDSQRKINHSDAALISDLYLKHKRELSHYIAAKYRCSQAEVEDIVQITFTRFLTLDAPSKIQSARAFLFKTANNIAIDIIRKSKVKEEYSQHTGLIHQREADELGPEEIAESRERLGLIAKAMWNMPSKRRKLLMMNRFDHLSYAEISRRVGLSETVVRRHIAKALVECHEAIFDDKHQSNANQ
ncbi:MAG: hypothetical protein COA42_10300 [Alteromonadaceae bacterium]|nr:MAG: hypothetical protein COA42_10300 [Alteromonadaceae bacterium]